MSTDKDSAILPNGFADTMPPTSEQQFLATNKILKLLQQFSYKYIETALIDKPTTFNNNSDELKKQCLKVISGSDNEVSFIRPDITPQVSRIAASLANNNLPLRFTYLGDVIRSQPQSLDKRKQQKQLGGEIFYSKADKNALNKELEIIFLALTSINNISQGNLVLDIQYPLVAEKLLADAISKDEISEIREILSKRNLSAASKSSNPQLLKGLIKACGNYKTAVKNIADLNKTPEINNCINKVNEINNFIESNFSNVEVTVDFIESRNFSYHNGISFSLFDKTSNSEIAKGGSYTNSILQKADLQASGFSIYVNSLENLSLNAVCSQKKQTKAVTISDNLNNIQSLLSEGVEITFKD